MYLMIAKQTSYGYIFQGIMALTYILSQDMVKVNWMRTLLSESISGLPLFTSDCVRPLIHDAAVRGSPI